jgi:hypothetical protein
MAIQIPRPMIMPTTPPDPAVAADTKAGERARRAIKVIESDDELSAAGGTEGVRNELNYEKNNKLCLRVGASLWRRKVIS